MLRLGIGMMAALCERTISFTFDARGSIGGLTHASYLCENSGYKCFRVGGSVASFMATAAPTATSDTALRAVATVTIAKE